MEQPVVRKTESWPHQCAAYAVAMRQRRVALSMGMGTGKSKVAIDVLQNTGSRRVLIVAPLAVLGEWPRQFERHAVESWQFVNIATLKGATLSERARGAARVLAATPGYVAVLVNYDVLWRDDLFAFAYAQNFDAVIFDECHKIKAYNSKVSKAASRIMRLRPTIRALFLSGTLMPHSPLDVFGTFRALDATVFGKNFTAFRTAYAVTDPVFPSKVRQWRNLDDLAARVATRSYHIGREVLTLPPSTDVPIAVTLSSAAMKAYRAMHEDLIAEVGDGQTCVAANVLARIIRCQQIAAGFAVVEGDPGRFQRVQVDRAKHDALAELFESMRAEYDAQQEPVVVFARFTPDLDTIGAVAEEVFGAGTYRELSGRRKDYEAWRDGAGVVLGVQIQSGGVGIDLTRARYCVYFTLSYSLGDYEQSRARVHRPGQTRPVTYYHLVATGTVDEDIYHALDKRRDVIAAVIASVARRSE